MFTLTLPFLNEDMEFDLSSEKAVQKQLSDVFKRMVEKVSHLEETYAGLYEAVVIERNDARLLAQGLEQKVARVETLLESSARSQQFVTTSFDNLTIAERTARHEWDEEVKNNSELLDANRLLADNFVQVSAQLEQAKIGNDMLLIRYNGLTADQSKRMDAMGFAVSLNMPSSDAYLSVAGRILAFLKGEDDDTKK